MATAKVNAAASSATRKNYVTLKQLQERRLKEQGDEEERLRNLHLDLNAKREEAARSSKDQPPLVSLRWEVAKPVSPSIPELDEAKRTADDPVPAPPIGEPAGGDRKPTWREKKQAKSDSEKLTGTESAPIESEEASSEEKSIAVTTEGEGRNRWGVGQPKSVGVPGGRGSEWPRRIDRQRFNGSYGAFASAPRRSWMPTRGGDGQRRLRNGAEAGSVWVRKTTGS
ncbi:uncharacterized protein LOC141813739 [Curcuma longa]|uniref:uncharacterized protein LOC141813739 n=1 Tax=Curcuma longa TaxID=136217 RepID=UPI003D9F0CC6